LTGLISEVVEGLLTDVAGLSEEAGNPVPDAAAESS